MNRTLALAYEGAARLARGLAALAPASDHKIVASFAARRGVMPRYAAFRRDPMRQLLWMHAPSVGEGLQARPILELMRERRPATQLAYTYFSPSARRFAHELDVDFRDVLPFDVAVDMRAALAALSPTALVFSKLDLWPTLAREASRRRTRLGLVSATLGQPPARVSVTGDTRYDQVWARAERVERNGALLAPLRSDRPTLVAGSTWPSDEAVLLPAWARVAARPSRPRLVIAPHEPTSAHLLPIESWAAGAGLRVARLGAIDSGEADVVVVDRVGVLGDLYALADVAYVGGAFHAAGLHSVLEPAAFGAPVLFGPRYADVRDARLLIDADAAQAVDDAAALERALDGWLGSPDTRLEAGRAARAVVHGGLGAVTRSYALVAELLGP